MKWPAHGSNPHYLFNALNKPLPDERIDFSANINPLGPPSLVKENWSSLINTVTDYPDPQGIRLKNLLSEREKIDSNQILLGNGGAEIITLIGRFLTGKKVVIVQPAFSEYEEVCRVNGCTIDYHLLQSGSWQWDTNGLAHKLKEADALFLCNPNNPTGVYFSKSILLNLLQLCQENECLLILDEAFYDFVFNHQSIVSYINDYSNLLIIRSMTKMFAIPGLRLGYLLADSKVINTLSNFQSQWSINSVALKVGEWCLESDSYVMDTIALITKERRRLFAFYDQFSFKRSPSETNFYLLRDPSLEDQLPLFEFLLEKGIIPRHTMNFPGVDGKWLRFAIKAPVDNDLLMEAMSAWRRNPLFL